MPHANLVPTSTFQTWYNLTNEIATTLRSNAVVTGITAEGVFSVGVAATTETNLSNSVFANSSVTQLRSNVAVLANVANVDIASALVTFRPAGGTNFQTAVLVNGAMTLAKTLAGTANVALTGKFEWTGNTTITANTIAMIGAFSVSNGVATFSSNVVVSNSSHTCLFVNQVAGLVGVGTAAPSYPFEVVGNTQITGNTNITGVLELVGATGRLVIPVGTDMWATV